MSVSSVFRWLALKGTQPSGTRLVGARTHGPLATIDKHEVLPPILYPGWCFCCSLSMCITTNALQQCLYTVVCAGPLPSRRSSESKQRANQQQQQQQQQSKQNKMVLRRHRLVDVRGAVNWGMDTSSPKCARSKPTNRARKVYH